MSSKEKIMGMVIVILLLILFIIARQNNKLNNKIINNNPIYKSRTKTEKKTTHIDTVYNTVSDTIYIYEPVSVTPVNDSVKKWDYIINEKDIKGTISTYSTGTVTKQDFKYEVVAKTITKIDSIETTIIDTIVVEKLVPGKEHKILLGTDLFIGENSKLSGGGINISYKTKANYQYTIGYNRILKGNYISIGAKLPLNFNK